MAKEAKQSVAERRELTNTLKRALAGKRSRVSLNFKVADLVCDMVRPMLAPHDRARLAQGIPRQVPRGDVFMDVCQAVGVLVNLVLELEQVKGGALRFRKPKVEAAFKARYEDVLDQGNGAVGRQRIRALEAELAALREQMEEVLEAATNPGVSSGAATE